MTTIFHNPLGMYLVFLCGTILILHSVISRSSGVSGCDLGGGMALPPITPTSLSLNFNGATFFSLSSLVNHLLDYPEGEQRVDVMVDVVEQTTAIFEFGSAFTAGLVKAIRKDKSWAIVKWSKNDVNELVAPLTRHICADGANRNRREGVLSTITKHWGPAVTGFFRSRNESEKCLRQIAHLASSPQIGSYLEARRFVNVHVVQHLIARPSRYSGRYETTTADWMAVNGLTPPTNDVAYDLLVAANVHFTEFGQLIEGPPPPNFMIPRVVLPPVVLSPEVPPPVVLPPTVLPPTVLPPAVLPPVVRPPDFGGEGEEEDEEDQEGEEQDKERECGEEEEEEEEEKGEEEDAEEEEEDEEEEEEDEEEGEADAPTASKKVVNAKEDDGAAHEGGNG